MNNKNNKNKDVSKEWYVRYIPKNVRSAYRRVCPRFMRVFLRERTKWFWILFALYLAGQWATIRVGFGIVFFVLSLIAFVFINLNYGDRKDGLSAYSVFNPKGERLPGHFDATHFENRIRTGGGLVG